MSFSNALTKIQFKVDHISLVRRAVLLVVLLVSIIVFWYFLIYRPQAQAAAEVAQQIRDLTHQTAVLKARNNSIISLVKSHDMDKVVAKFQSIKKEIQNLNQQVSNFHHRYVSDEELANLLHSLLKDMKDITIENFSTLMSNNEAVANPAGKSAVDSSGKATTPTPSPNTSATPTPLDVKLAPETTHYSLSLKGDYFAILHFLQRVEQVKWQLFWEKLDYQVEHYPNAIATIKFYTLKPRSQAATPIPAATQGVLP